MRFSWQNLAFFSANLINFLCLENTNSEGGYSRYNLTVMEQAPNILVVDDDPAIVELVGETLAGVGMHIVPCTDATQALALFEQMPVDLVMLDVMMPGMDGFELCYQIRKQSHVPVIFLSAKGEEADKVLGLMSGADDYITKPFLPRELVARVKSCLRRASYAVSSAQNVLECRGIELNRTAHSASLHGTELALTPKEFDVLALLLAARGKPVATSDLYEAVWGEQYLASSANSVMVHIRHLRTKLSKIDSEQVFIETVWGVGYKIAPYGA